MSTPTARGARSAAQGILADDRTQQREAILDGLKKAYWMEIETVMSYITNSVNPDGVRAQEIIESLRRTSRRSSARAAVRHAHQGALRRRPRFQGVRRRAGRAAAARAPDRRRPRHQGRDRGRDRRDRALQRAHRDTDGVDPSRTTWSSHPPRRGGPPPALRGLPARVRGRRPRLAVGGSGSTSGSGSGSVRHLGPRGDRRRGGLLRLDRRAGIRLRRDDRGLGYGRGGGLCWLGNCHAVALPDLA